MKELSGSDPGAQSSGELTIFSSLKMGTSRYAALQNLLSRKFFTQPLGPKLGMPYISKRDEFSEKFQTAFDTPPPHFRKVILRISQQNCDNAYVHYGRTVVYYMILFPMRCM